MDTKGDLKTVVNILVLLALLIIIFFIIKRALVRFGVS